MRLHLIAVAAFIIFSAPGCASNPPPPPAPPSSPSALAAAGAAPQAATPVKPAGEAKVGDRTRCPTSDEEFVVTADSPKVDYKGKTYYFCCSGCDQKFARDPEKYLGRGKPPTGT
ncbi:MAG: YHS domain-containing protein [Labilithrix sp.]